jgi:hypothetical protein
MQNLQQKNQTMEIHPVCSLKYSMAPFNSSLLTVTLYVLLSYNNTCLWHCNQVQLYFLFTEPLPSTNLRSAALKANFAA